MCDNLSRVVVAPLPLSLVPRPNSSILQAGTRLGRYEVIGELGNGGMATVYFGRALAVAGFQRMVAIKFLHPHLLKDRQFVQMFLDEGRLAAGILHPNVVATLDLEHTDDGLYIVMEYIEGDQLLGLFRNARAASKRIPFGVTLRVALDVLNGLHAAHELADEAGNQLRIVHRDVSPHNILVGTDGIGRITDFGIAKAEERISDTRDGIVKGKLSYMAPEQTGDGPVDRRADIFSAATVVWECLTGRRLFPGRTDGEVLKNLLQNPIPRLRDVDPELPQTLDDVLSRALSRDANLRYNSAHEFADALEAAATPTLGIAPPRLVARYVREVASSKVGEEQRLRRAHPTQNLPVYRPPATPSQVRTLSTPPAQGEDAPTKVQPAAGQLGAHAPSEAPLVAPAALPSVPPPPRTDAPPDHPATPAVPVVSSSATTEEFDVIDPGLITEVLPFEPEAREPSPARSVVVFVLVLVLGTLVGTGIFYALDARGHRGAPESDARRARPPEPVSVVVPPPPVAPLRAITPEPPEPPRAPPQAPPQAPPRVPIAARVVAPTPLAHPAAPARTPVVRVQRPVPPPTPTRAVPPSPAVQAPNPPTAPSDPPPLPTAI